MILLFILQNNSSSFMVVECEFPNHRVLARFTVQGMCSNLWSSLKFNKKVVGCHSHIL